MVDHDVVARKIANAKGSLIFTMQAGGLVDPVAASRADFDPLSIIDKPANAP